MNRETPDLHRSWGQRLKLLAIVLLGAGALLAGCYYSYRQLFRFQRHRAIRELNEALARQDQDALGDLLARHRQSPVELLSGKELFAYQSHLELMRRVGRQRSIKYRQKIAALRRALSDKNFSYTKWLKDLWRAAADAPCQDDLAELYKLHELAKLQSETAQWQTAQKALQDLKLLQQKAAHLSQLRRNKKWDRHRQSSRELLDRIAAFKQANASIPALAAAGDELIRQINGELWQSKSAEKNQAAEEKAFEEVLQQPTKELILKSGRNFIKIYPESIYTPELRRLPDKFKVLEFPWRQQVEKQIANLQSQRSKALAFMQKALNKLDEQLKNKPLYELKVRLADGRIQRCLTFERARSSGGKIEFTDLNNRRIQGSFPAGAEGTLTVNGRSRSAELLMPAGESLPRADIQDEIQLLNGKFRRMSAGEFPRELDGFSRWFQKERAGLPRGLRLELLEIDQRAKNLLSPAGKHLTDCGSWFEFQLKVYQESLHYLPVWCGLYWQKAGQGKYFPDGTVRSNNDVWHWANGRMRRAGSLRGERVTVKGLADGITVLMTAAGEVDAGKRRRELEDLARKQGWPRPEFPVYWAE